MSVRQNVDFCMMLRKEIAISDIFWCWRVIVCC